VQLAENLGIRALQYHPEKLNWDLIAEKLLGEPVSNIGNRPPRYAEVARHVMQKSPAKPKKQTSRFKYGWTKRA